METIIRDKINSYLSFHLGEEIFATNVGTVLSILEMVRITKIPCSPNYLKGVINLRGEVLPVVDLRVKLGMSIFSNISASCILVMELSLDNQNVKLGVIVDSVSEVHIIDLKDILPSPGISTKLKSQFIEGMYKNGNSFIMLLDMVNIFSSDELMNISSSSEIETVTAL